MEGKARSTFTHKASFERLDPKPDHGPDEHATSRQIREIRILADHGCVEPVREIGNRPIVGLWVEVVEDMARFIALAHKTRGQLSGKLGIQQEADHSAACDASACLAP